VQTFRFKNKGEICKVQKRGTNEQLELKTLGAVRRMVSAADKPAETDMLGEKNTVQWLISQTDKFKRMCRNV
jgi:hypothetical protein